LRKTCTTKQGDGRSFISHWKNAQGFETTEETETPGIFQYQRSAKSGGELPPLQSGKGSPHGKLDTERTSGQASDLLVDTALHSNSNFVGIFVLFMDASGDICVIILYRTFVF